METKILVFWLAVTCIAAVSAGSAVETQDLGGCLSSFTSVEGCVEAIQEAITHKKFTKIKHECCIAITQLGDNCWPLIYPDQPYVPLLLKAICKFLGNAAKVQKLAASPPY